MRIENVSYFFMNLKGISTTSVEINLIPGNTFLQNIVAVMNAAETNKIEKNIQIQTF